MQETNNKEEILEYARLVRSDPQHNAAWLNLGNALGSLSMRDESGTVYDGIQCYSKCLDNDDLYWRAWYNLGMRMKNNDVVNIRGTDYSRKDCLTKCLDINGSADTANAWLQLGVLLFDGNRGQATATIGDGDRKVVVNDKACFIRALELNPTLSDAWHNVGLVSQDGAPPVVSEQEYSPTQCFVRAVETKPTNARAWYSLAVDLRRSRVQDGTSGTTHVADGDGNLTSVSEESCLREAIKNDPALAHAWCLLATIIREKGGAAMDVEQVSYTEKAALLKALECDRQCALAWTNLSPALGYSDKAVVGGNEYDAQTASLRALECYEGIPQAWYNLGATLINKTGDAATVRSPSAADGGAAVNAKECFARALACDPEYGRAWYSLGTCMSPSEAITVNGVSHNKYDCIAKGERYGKLWDTTAPTETVDEPQPFQAQPSTAVEEL